MQLRTRKRVHDPLTHRFHQGLNEANSDGYDWFEGPFRSRFVRLMDALAIALVVIIIASVLA